MIQATVRHALKAAQGGPQSVPPYAAAGVAAGDVPGDTRSVLIIKMLEPA